MSTDTAIVGGTFDVVHDGHKALLNEAFRVGDEVMVGITTDEKANESREREVFPLQKRRSNLEDTCKTLSNIHGAVYYITEIEDNFGMAVTSVADYIVLSPEPKTHERAQMINEAREEEPGLDRLRIVEAPMVHDHQGRKISSTRIRNGEIDRHGGDI